MLDLLLDEHLTSDIVPAARKLCRGIRVVSIREWSGGHFVGAPDVEILQEAARQRVTLVTFDLKTIPLLLRAWADHGTDHGGVVLVDGRTIAQNDVGRMARALAELWRRQGQLDWTNRVFFLQTPRS